MFNRLGFHCVACGKSLTGGIDTYGDYDAPLCQACYFKHVPDNTAASHQRMLLQDEEEKLIYEHAVLREQVQRITRIADMEPVEARAKAISRRLWQIDRVLSEHL